MPLISRRRVVAGAISSALVPHSVMSRSFAQESVGKPHVVKLFVHQTISDLAPVAASTPLPATSVCMEPGDYVFNGVGYNCQQSGLYLFWDGNSLSIHARLVMVPGDLYGFLSGVSWHHVHGAEDETEAWQTISNGGMTHKWRLRCGYIAGLMKWMLPQYGYSVRIVNVETLESHNGVDDGHVLFETWDAALGKWLAWDLTNSCYFRAAGGGEHLSVAEVIEAGVLNVDHIALDNDTKRNASYVSGFCFASYGDMLLHDDAQIAKWFAHIYQSWSVGSGALPG